MLKLHVPLPIHSKRQQLFPLLKPFEKGEGFTDVRRIALYGISENEIRFVDSMAEADWVVLPMSWNFYHAHHQLTQIDLVVRETDLAGKKVLSFMTGDFGVKIPNYKNVFVFRHSGHRSKLPITHRGLPVFITDPLAKTFKTNQLSSRPYTETPTVGFCGQADDRFTTRLKELARTGIRNMASSFGADTRDPQQWISTSYLRASLLKKFEKSPTLATHFIYRKKYRAGATDTASRERTTLEFYTNMKESDYVVCVRGAGNFSVRFYEALAMGRIPVFLDTDCLLPLAETVAWKKHVVWVAYKDRDRIVEKVREFHQGLSPTEFKDLQYTNRKLYQEKLSLGGFFKEFLQEKP